MTDQELNEQTAEQDNADFLSGFNAVRPDNAQALPEPKPEEPELSDDKPEQPEAKEENQPEQSNDEQEEATYFGMTESQVKSLLERSARVDEIESQLRKAHGKIGELNANLQNLAQQKPTQQAPVDTALADIPEEWTEQFPEVVAIAQKIAAETISKQLSSQQPAQAQVPDEDGLTRAINLAVMDATHEGWRDTVASQDFTLWIATQPQDVQDTFNTTISAKELGKVIKDFDGWKAKTQDRSSRNKQRLEQAIVPTSSNAKVSHAPTPHDEFLAGFNAVRGRY